MARAVVSVLTRSGTAIPARLPAGVRSLTSSLANAVEEMASRQTLSSKAGCMVVFFRKKGKTVAAQRCDNRHLATGAKARWNKMKGKKVCRGKVGKAKGKFVACR